MRRLIAILFWVVSCAVATAHAQEPRKYALLIGIEDYRIAGDDRKVSVPRLTYPIDDVNKLQQLLEADNWKVLPLRDTSATHEQISMNLASYDSVLRKDDTFLVYFAGHGVRNRRGATFWLAYDTTPTMLDYKGIRLTNLLQIVADLPPLTKIVILDHCYAGNVQLLSQGGSSGDGSRSGTPTPPPDSWQFEAPSPDQTRGVLPTDVVQSIAALKDQVIVFSAARGPAFERSDLGHGLFTHFLARALETSDADTTQDSQLSVIELATYLSREIESYAQSHGLQQVPDVSSFSPEGLVQFAQRNLFSLTPIKPSALKAKYLRKIAEWNKPSRKWISDRSAVQLSDALVRWVESVLNKTALSKSDEVMVAAVKAAVENREGTEQARAEMLDATAANERDTPTQ